MGDERCAHLTVGSHPAMHPGGTKSAQWLCESCGTAFVLAAVPAPDARTAEEDAAWLNDFASRVSTWDEHDEDRLVEDVAAADRLRAIARRLSAEAGPAEAPVAWRVDCVAQDGKPDSGWSDYYGTESHATEDWQARVAVPCACGGGHRLVPLYAGRLASPPQAASGLAPESAASLHTRAIEAAKREAGGEGTVAVPPGPLPLVLTKTDLKKMDCPFPPEPDFAEASPAPRAEATDVSSRLAWQHCTERPRVVTLCGSTRFMDEFFRSGWAETLAGRLVFSVGVVIRDEKAAASLPNDHLGEHFGVKEQLDEIHFRKIDLSDEILVLNVGGYIGKSTQREIAYAIATHKGVRFLNPKDGEATLRERAHELGQQVAAFVEGRIPDAK